MKQRFKSLVITTNSALVIVCILLYVPTALALQGGSSGTTGVRTGASGETGSPDLSGETGNSRYAEGGDLGRPEGGGTTASGSRTVVSGPPPDSIIIDAAGSAFLLLLIAITMLFTSVAFLCVAHANLKTIVGRLEEASADTGPVEATPRPIETRDLGSSVNAQPDAPSAHQNSESEGTKRRAGEGQRKGIQVHLSDLANPTSGIIFVVACVVLWIFRLAIVLAREPKQLDPIDVVFFSPELITPGVFVAAIAPSALGLVNLLQAYSLGAVLSGPLRSQQNRFVLGAALIGILHIAASLTTIATVFFRP